jgi:hypothetical protein
MENKMIECCFCGIMIDELFSNNAEPAFDGRCCDYCNDTIVIPTRIVMLKCTKDRKGE